MNKDMTSKSIMKDQWKQIRGQAKMWWSRLTDDDLNQINGDYDRLISKLQERYSYKREQAITEIDRHLKELEQASMSTH